MRFCEQQKIIIFFLLPHTSHILQPLDVGVFNVYKHWHSDIVLAASHAGCGPITKNDFLASLKIIRDKTFKPRTIMHGFRDTGIVPYNPQIVIDQLDEQPLTPISTDENNSDSTTFRTPQTANRFQIVSDRLLQYDAESPAYTKTLNSLVKGAVSQAHLIEQLRRELTQSQAAQNAQRLHKQASRHRVPLGGVISSNELQRMKRIHEISDETEAIIKWKSKWSLVIAELRKHVVTRGLKIKNQRLRKTRSNDQGTETPD